MKSEKLKNNLQFTTYNLRLYKSFPLIAFILGLWYFCIRILGYNFEYIPGDLGDSRFINYLLEHGYRWFIREDIDFWNADFLYPFKNTIALSDSMLGTAPLYSLWRLLGFSPETSFQLWWICICSLNYWISYIIFNKWFKDSNIALILAWIFAFTIFNLGQLNYMQMIIRFMIPVVFYSAYKIIESPSIKYFLFYCIGIVFQFYCVMYTGFYLLYFSLLFILTYYIISKKWKVLFYYIRKENFIYSSTIIIISIGAMLWLFIPYIKMSKIVETLQYEEILPYIPIWKYYLFPTETSLTWNFLFNLTRPDDSIWWVHYLFIGFIPFIIIVISPFYLIYNMYKKIKTPLLIKSIFITSTIILLFNIKIGTEFSLYYFLFKLPGIDSLRYLTRFMNVEIFLLLLLLGYLLIKINKKYIIIIMVLVFIDNLFSAENIPRKEKTELINRKTTLLTKLNKFDYKKYKAVAYWNANEMSFVTNLDMMLVSQSLGMNTINGYSSYCPQGLFDFTKLSKIDGLYNWLDIQNIIKDDVLLIKILTKEQQINEMIKQSVNYIKTDKEWMESIRKKAVINKISVDSMVTLDAIWTVKTNNPDLFN